VDSYIAVKLLPGSPRLFAASTHIALRSPGVQTLAQMPKIARKFGLSGRRESPDGCYARACVWRDPEEYLPLPGREATLKSGTP
jgi:hypothetical protein